MTCLRGVLDAVFHLLRTGGQWRLLKCCFPLSETVIDVPSNRLMLDRLALSRRAGQLLLSTVSKKIVL